MDSKHISHEKQHWIDKDIWQKQTFENIKHDLISARSNRFVNYDAVTERHIIMVYGKAQVGKTTLILSMMGIREEELPHVSATLRAGIAKGNSSTSTAIIYSMSENHCYGYAIGNADYAFEKEITYLDEKGMQVHLSEVREKVESGQLSRDMVLFLYIPRNLFEQDAGVEQISIMDMPGVNSRNHREDNHVRNLMARYLPVMSVCVMVCKSNEIQSLENLELPNRVDWKRMPHRFPLVITYAYSDANTKKFFYTNRQDRVQSFHDFVIGEYQKEITKILKDNQLAIFPVEVGESMKNLCAVEIMEEADRREVWETWNKVRAELLKFIKTKKGQRLKPALNDLQALATNHREEERLRLHRQLEKQQRAVTDLEYRQNVEKEFLKTLRDDYSKDEELRDRYRNLKNAQKVMNELTMPGYTAITGMPSEVLDFVKDNNLFSKSGETDILRDREKKVMKFIRNYNAPKEYLNELVQLLQNNDVSCSDLRINRVLFAIDASCILPYEPMIYPAWQGLFRGTPKVDLNELRAICTQIQGKINQIIAAIAKTCQAALDEEIRRVRREDEEHVLRMRTQMKKLEALGEKIGNEEKKKLAMEKDLESIDQERTSDKEILETYLQYAQNAYLEQRNHMIAQINSNPDPCQKTMMVLSLGLLDQDYEQTTGGFRTNEHQ